MFFGGLLCLILGRWFGSWKSLPKICVQADVRGIETALSPVKVRK